MPITVTIEKSHYDALHAEVEALRAQVGAKQAEIDRLMLEYCPDEMTPEQVAEWGKHQRPVLEDRQHFEDVSAEALHALQSDGTIHRGQLADVIRRLRDMAFGLIDKQAERSLAGREWVSVDERLPKLGDHCWIWIVGAEFATLAVFNVDFNKEAYWKLENGNNRNDMVIEDTSHWMPACRPAAPVSGTTKS
jgi:hypothetical protein